MNLAGVPTPGGGAGTLSLAASFKGVVEVCLQTYSKLDVSLCILSLCMPIFTTGSETSLPASLTALFQKLRDRSRSTYEQGAFFEAFLRKYFTTDPYYSSFFDAVWRWDEWPERWGRDTGIDLVARERVTGALWAIQAKFYDNHAQLTLNDIATFLAVSNTSHFTERLIVSTTNLWAKAAEDALLSQRTPVKRLSLLEIGESRLDWTDFDPDRVETLRRLDAHTLMPHQTEALTDVCAGLAEHPRGKCVFR